MSIICVVVSNRVVSLCLCRSDNQAEGKVVLSALHIGKKEETLTAYKHSECCMLCYLYSICCLFDCFIVSRLHADIVNNSL